MSMQFRAGPRVPFRVDPLPLESPRGYLCRVAGAHCYDRPGWLVQLAGLRLSELESESCAIAKVLRLEPDEWLAMLYRHVKGVERFEQRSFQGRVVRSDQFNYRHPRICPHCLREQPVWWAAWDLALVAACPKRRCVLIDQCPTCERKIGWHRPAVHQCRCGADLRKIATTAASASLAAINTIIYRGAAFIPNAPAELELNNFHLPAELMQLGFGSLLRLIRFLGLIGDKDRLRRKQRPFPRTDLRAAIHASEATIETLRDWPRPFREALTRMVPEQVSDPAALKFSDIFGNFYRHLFRVLPRREFGFLHDAFERFVIEDWKGLVRGQHRFFSAATRRHSQWMPAEEAEKIAHVNSKRIVALVRQGEIEGIFSKVSRGQGRSEYWIKRESLNSWIGARDLELAQYMRSPEAQRTLGLKHATVLRVAAVGLIRYARGAERYFPTGYHFLREDVMKIKNAFDHHAAPTVQDYDKPGGLIALRHALKNYLGRDLGLPAVIRAVIDGSPVPVACTKRFRGITGYLFLSDDLRKYRPVLEVKVPAGGFLNYREAASMLGTRTEVIRSLVAQGVLSTPTEYRDGFSKLVPARDVPRFAERYVAAPVLAKCLHLDHRSAVSYLKKLAMPVLSIPVPDKGHALFLSREVVAQVRIPSSEH
jgi:hypothetical protein